MLKKRNAQGLPIRIIILAVIALIVLIVVMAIFGKEMGENVKRLESCASKGGACKSQEQCPLEERIYGVDCEAGKVCCAQYENRSYV